MRKERYRGTQIMRDKCAMHKTNTAWLAQKMSASNNSTMGKHASSNRYETEASNREDKKQGGSTKIQSQSDIIVIVLTQIIAILGRKTSWIVRWMR